VKAIGMMSMIESAAAMAWRCWGSVGRTAVVDATRRLTCIMDVPRYKTHVNVFALGLFRRKEIVLESIKRSR
jgi:hypothetical protein